MLVFSEPDQGDALGVASERRYVLRRGAHQGAAIADQHDFLVAGGLDRTDHGAVAFRGLDRDHALATPALHREIADQGTLAVSVFGGKQDLAIVGIDRDQRNDFIAVPDLDTAHAGGGAAHRTDVVFVDADALAGAGEQHQVGVAVG